MALLNAVATERQFEPDDGSYGSRSAGPPRTSPQAKAAADLAAARALNGDIDREMARIHVSAPTGM